MSSVESPWLLYGANGFTGELIAREAVARGLRPVLAGRRKQSIQPLAAELGLEHRVIALDDAQRLRQELKPYAAVLHCAGPFVRTSAPMVDACIGSRTHYLDITGEIGVFEAIMQRNAAAVTTSVSLVPGVGFDVVPTDCLAAMLAEKMPDAVELTLAFNMRGGTISRGTMKTMIEGIGEGGAIREAGRIKRVPTVYDVREIPFASKPRIAFTIPWGDVSTAFHSTGIPNIRVYLAASPRAISRARLMRRMEPLLRLRPARALLQRLASAKAGPTPEMQSTGSVELWGSVRNVAGDDEVTMTMTTPEAYRFTALSALAAVEKLLSNPRPGSHTPSKMFGARFVTEIDGVSVGGQ